MNKRSTTKIGGKYGSYIVLSKSDRTDNNNHTFYNVRCENCGRTKVIRSDTLKNIHECRKCRVYPTGEDHSGLIHKHTINGKKTPTYRSWERMWARCTDPNHQSYYNYNVVEIDPEWKEFKNFLKDVGSRPSKDYFLHRIDKEDGYYKANTTWMHKCEKPKWRRNTHAYQDNLPYLKIRVLERKIGFEWMDKYKSRRDTNGRTNKRPNQDSQLKQDS